MMNTQLTSMIQGLDINLDLDLLPRGWDVILSPRFITYMPYVEILIETPNYILKTAKASRELIDVFDLRYRCFLEDKETGSNDALDIDEWDHICDHMVIQCRESQKIIGTYRMISSDRSDKFYSQSEFQMDQFLNTEGKKLELGRACIDPAHRNGNVIDLLWRGIAKYIKKTETRFLFGCSSVHTLSTQLGANLYSLMQSKSWVDESFSIVPTEEFRFDYQDAEDDLSKAKDHIPALLRSYIMAGAKIYAPPALDKDFECIDFLTILDMENITRLYKKRYFKYLLEENS
ncbi:MAG: GNAT family N-acetyltransferase [Bacteriovoracaceae bacterium]